MVMILFSSNTTNLTMYLQWTILLLFTLAENSYCAHRRTKRIINGDPFTGRPGTVYHAIRYYGAMGSLHNVPFFTLGYHDWKWLINLGVYGNVDCSGSLVAPMIFQTACHCVAHFLVNTGLKFIPPVLKEHWEHRSYIYVGTSRQYGDESMQSYAPIISERFLVHKKCGKLGDNGATSYDYGLIRLDLEWRKADWHTPFNWEEIDYAPQYTDRQIVQFHVHALFKQSVCMMMGFGDYVKGSPLESEVLRYGWGILLPHNLCVAKTARINGTLLTKDEQKQMMSWVCTDTIPTEIYETAGGDSGGPLTCDDRYYGILSGGIELTRIDGQIERHSIYSTLLHSLYSTAINYRADLIHLMYMNATKFPPRRMQAKEASIFSEQETEDSHFASHSSPTVLSAHIIYLSYYCVLNGPKPWNM